MSVETLSPRALNRATLERQMLLRRSEMPVPDAVEHLVRMQAQLPLNPYVGLWSRLARFRPAELAQLLLDRRVVRIVLMRATVHLVSAGDCLLLRPLMQPVLDTPAPPRFLPEYDNVLLSHADRTRFITDEQRAVVGALAPKVQGAVLLDGSLRGTWRVERDRDSGHATLIVDHVGRLTKRAMDALSAEGRRLLRLIAADADSTDVGFVALA